MFLPMIAGSIGFLLFLIYDINSFTANKRLPGTFFFAGTALIAVSTVCSLTAAFRAGAFSGIADILLMIAGAVSLAALIYSLFFALPFEGTYLSPDSKRHVYDRGVYALCRHPGVLFFFAAYLFTGLAALPSPFLVSGMLFSVLNVLYVCFQDRITFPRTFCDYEEYRHRVPFLIPTAASIRLMCRTMRHTTRKEDSK